MSMQNDTGPKSPPKTDSVSLQSPQPPSPDKIKPEVQDIVTMQENEQEPVAIVVPATETGELPGKVQDLDWNNGRPDVTNNEVEQLPSHQTAEIANGEKLRENKGSKPGENPFEASEEVTTGQSGG